MVKHIVVYTLKEGVNKAEAVEIVRAALEPLVGVIPGLQEFAQFFINEQTSGFGSILEEAGLIPLSDDERAEVLANIREQRSL